MSRTDRIGIVSIIVALIIWFGVSIAPHTFGEICKTRGHEAHSVAHGECVQGLARGGP